jgi:hypothetical protein
LPRQRNASDGGRDCSHGSKGGKAGDGGTGSSKAEVEAAAAAVELEALCASNTGSSVSADDDRDNELKLAREAAREQAVQWAATHP